MKAGDKMNLGMENETLEFKRSTSECKEAMSSICAMLNKHHYGEVYFGIRPDGTPIGQDITEDTLRTISQKISNCIEPKIYPKIQKVIIDDKECIHVTFEGDRVPYFVSGVAKIRVADEDLTMSPQELAEFIHKSQAEVNRWENQISSKSVDDADEALLESYTNHAHEIGRIAITYTDRATVLNQLELIQGKLLINAGKVLFCDSISQDIQFAVFATEERLTFNDIQRHHGPIFKLIDIAETYIRNHINWKVEFDGSIKRKEIPEIPMDAVREALVNSFCHKDYASGQSNEVAIYKDRIEIYSPGQFPDGYEPIDFINHPERPIRRNPKIAQILYYSKDIESFGTGLKRIKDSCDEAGVRCEFVKLKSGFVVCFYRANFSTTNSLSDHDKVENSSQISLDKTSAAILKFLKENNKITNKDAQNITGLKPSRVRDYLRQLVDLGLIRRVGKNKNSFYIIDDYKK